MQFEWDPVKDRLNQTKHGISFVEATTVFDDPLQWTIPDPDHSLYERRYLTTGLSAEGRLLIVAHTEEADDRMRIINAPAATTAERKTYEEGG
ncbi:MAG TPA: BrnT family toxin [Thermoanaerobaculia bacterium]|nr:BrnT family toxin [Thermoanaerobaculia bacterium]